MKISEFTVPELQKYRENCNFTYDEMVLFDYRASNIPLEECAERMNISISTANRINKKVKNKIERVRA